ncbi:MAG: hypothetical protein ACK5DL_14270 [Burkholderiales bacterium]|nr:hypothetical protein [Betaproteobacteria bacterium]
MLGAGASVPYGFPVGRKLAEDLCRFSNGTDFTLSNLLSEKHEYPFAGMNKLLRQFHQSGRSSIDSFLGSHDNLVAIGKILIAHELCAKEVPKMLRSPAIDDHWYEYLWNRLAASVVEPADLPLKNLKIISFNYDRSLEEYLYLAISNSFSEDCVYDTIRRLEMMHVYGSLGRHKTQPGSQPLRPYEPADDATSLEVAAAGINILSDDRDDSPEFQKGQDWFSWAEQICFLGFGFDETNVDRLGLYNVIDTKKKRGEGLPDVIFSAFGRTKAEVQHIKTLLFKEHLRSANVTAIDANSLMTLRESGVLLAS